MACGEVGLGGELRHVPQLARRLAEAARLGFHTALVPFSAPEPPEGITFRVEAPLLHHQHKLTPYAGRELAGVVEATFLRGRRIYELGLARLGGPATRGKFLSGPIGSALKRDTP